MGREVKREVVYEELVNTRMGCDEMERRRTLQAQKEQSQEGEKQQGTEPLTGHGRESGEARGRLD